MLAAARVGPYLRAVRAAADALALDRDGLDLEAVHTHLAALDPALSGDLFSPAEVDDATGMPAWTWLHRAHAEQRAPAAPPAAAQSARQAQRRRAREHLAGAPLLPCLPVFDVAWSRTDPPTARLAWAAVLPDGGWLRASVEIAVDRALPHQRAPTLGPASHASLARAALLPLPALTRLAALRLDGALRSARRVRIGPLWFPDVELPAGVPAELGQGVALHARTEVIERTLEGLSHADPLEPPGLADAPPEGFGLHIGRRIAAFGRALDAARAWANDLGMPSLVQPIAPAGGLA